MLINHFLTVIFFKWTDGNPLTVVSTDFFFAVGVLNNFIPQTQVSDFLFAQFKLTLGPIRPGSPGRPPSPLGPLAPTGPLAPRLPAGPYQNKYTKLGRGSKKHHVSVYKKMVWK